MAGLLARLEFECRVEGERVIAKTPPHRLDIGEGATGKADLLEEVARIYGYDRIPNGHLADDLPPQRNNPPVELEEKVRDLLAGLGLLEVVSYRLTSPEREARLLPPGVSANQEPYVRLQNPIALERSVMRRSVLASVMEALERNARLSDRLALFEIGPVFLPQAGQDLPDEPRRLAIALSGVRQDANWDQPAAGQMDFFDLKGVIEGLLEGMHIQAVVYEPAGEGTVFHPGKCARLVVDSAPAGIFGELHPLVKDRYDLGEGPVLAADLDLEMLLAKVPVGYVVESVPVFPPVLEDIAVIVDESVPAVQVEELIRQAGGKTLAHVRLFDIYRGSQIGEGKKSLAYSLTYLAPDKTLTDEEAAAVRKRIIRRLEQELGARLRG
jgi:phenylalanyl-tRNA synthetase beta chain